MKYCCWLPPFVKSSLQRGPEHGCKPQISRSQEGMRSLFLHTHQFLTKQRACLFLTKSTHYIPTSKPSYNVEERIFTVTRCTCHVQEMTHRQPMMTLSFKKLSLEKKGAFCQKKIKYSICYTGFLLQVDRKTAALCISGNIHSKQQSQMVFGEKNIKKITALWKIETEQGRCQTQPWTVPAPIWFLIRVTLRQVCLITGLETSTAFSRERLPFRHSKQIHF